MSPFVPAFHLATSIIPAASVLLEATGRFKNVRSGQVRLSGFVDFSSGLNVACIFVIDLDRGKP